MSALTPFDGMEIGLAVDDAAGIVWHLRYNANAASKPWEFIGGPPLTSYVSVGEATSSTTTADLATVGPQFTLPRGGDYQITWGSRCTLVSGAAGTYGIHGIALVSTYVTHSFSAVNDWRTGSLGININNGSQGQVIKTQYQISTGASSVNFQMRYAWLTPTRLS